MNFLKSKTKVCCKQNAASEPIANIGYTRLEPRQVLSASFVFGAGSVLLDGFDAGQDFSFGQQNAIVNGASQDAYIFTVDSGSFTGNATDPLVELESVNGGIDNRLEIATSFFGSPLDANFAFDGLIAGSATDQVSITQFTPTFTFETLHLENFTNVDQSLELNTIGDVTTGDLTVADSNPNDNINPAVDIRIATTGTIEIEDNTSLVNEVNNPNSGISIRANGTGNDVFVSGAIQTSVGEIDVLAEDELRMRTSGSTIDAGTGRVTLTSLSGDVFIGAVTSQATGDAISIDSAGGIFDNSNNESSNLSAANGRIVLNSGSNIGLAGDSDIDIQSQFVAFNTPGVVALSDLAAGLNIDVSSTAGSGFVQAAGDLRISANVSFNGAMDFTATNDLIIQNNVFVTQNANAPVAFTGVNFQMEDGSAINSAGQVIVEASSNVLLSEIDSAAANDAIVINAGGDIIDNTAAESANLSAAGRIVLSGASIGSTGIADIDIESRLLQFNSPGEVVLSDLAAGVSIDQSSSANRASIDSNGALVVSADVSLNESSTFTANNSSNVNDDIRIENGAVIGLNSNVDSVLTLTAGDDIIFDSGQIITSGTGIHLVALTADNESNIDTDRGSITTTAGSLESIITNDLMVSAFDGIGDSSDGINAAEPLRINVNRLTAFTSGSGDIQIAESNSIELVEVQTTDGAISVTANDDILATSVISGETESTEDSTDDVSLTSTNGSINLQQILVADDLSVQAANGNIFDGTGSLIDVDGDALFVADELIQLANNSSDFIQVIGNATFEAEQVLLGIDDTGDNAGANTFFGSITIDVDQLVLIENDAIEFSGVNSFTDLFVFTNQSISNAADTILSVDGHTQLNAGVDIVLGNQANDSFSFGSIGVVAPDAHIELDSSVVIDASVPDQDIANFGRNASQGTEVSGTLFLTSTGSIEQSSGSLNVANLGLQSDEFVHLSSVSELNNTVAISAGTSGALTNVNAIQTLQSLADLENSEVNAALGQSISIHHAGTLNVTTVTSHFDTSQIDGLQTSDGSIFATSVENISIQENITARSPTADPQATIYSAAGDVNNPGVLFEGGEIEVIGNTNAGIVNANQTFANFFGDDGFVIRGTTEILVLNTDGSADQQIVLDIGNVGETGYRVGIVWDGENQPGSPVENINTFVPNPDVASEAFEDEIVQNNTTTLHPFSGVGGERVTLQKIESYTAEAVILHQESPNVFSTVTVRNDQDINLFAGALRSVSNALNETEQTLRAEFDQPRREAPNLPKITPINPIEIKTIAELPISSSAPESSSTLTFDRDVQTFETGDLKWVQVTIELEDLEEFGDEVRIKDPTKVFAKSDGAEIVDLDDEIGENEVEKIIEDIEKNEKAESGYWYKVFKDYQNRDDELFFYHFKTGDSQIQSDQADDSQLNPEASDLDTTDTDQSPGNELEEIERKFVPPERPGSDFEPIPETSESESDSNSTSFSPQTLSATGLMAASLLIQKTNSAKKKDDSAATQPDCKKSELTSSRSKQSQPKFSRLDRIKRRIQNAIRGRDN